MAYHQHYTSFLCSTRIRSLFVCAAKVMMTTTSIELLGYPQPSLVIHMLGVFFKG